MNQKGYLKKNTKGACSIIILMILILVGCSKKEDTIKIGVLKVADSFALYTAYEEKLFEKNGVNVELIEFSSASNQSSAYEAGELDGIMTDLVVQMLINKNAGDNRLKIVANALGSTQKEGRFLVVSSQNSNIITPKELEGATIAISEHTMMQYLVESYLNELKVDSSAITFVNIPSLSLRLDAVIEGGETQAAILPDPLAIEAVQKGCNVVINDTTLEGNYSQSVISMNQKILEDSPEKMEKFLAAYNEAILRINENSQQYKDLFYEKIAVSDEIKELYEVPSFTENSVPKEENVSRIQDWMLQLGLIDEKSTYEEVIWN